MFSRDQPGYSIVTETTNPAQVQSGLSSQLIQMIAELLEADQIVIGTPMYNFAVPAVVNAWIDHIVRGRKNFQLSGDGTGGTGKGPQAGCRGSERRKL
jgi:FMN-dependent NADH-azoreductase